MPARTTHPTVTVREKPTTKGVRLYLDIYHAGERKRQSLPLLLTGDRYLDAELRQRAEAVRKEVERDLTQAGMPERKVSRTMLDALDGVAARATPSILTLTRKVRRLIEQVAGDTPVDRVTEAQLRGLLSVIRDGRQPKTVSIYWWVVLRTLDYAFSEGWIDQPITNHLPKVKAPKESKREFLTEEELRMLLSTPVDARIRDAFVCGVLTGLRVSDIRRLEARHVVPASGGVEIRMTAKKTGTALRLPLSRAAADLLSQQVALHPTGALFPIPSSARLSAHITRWAQRAGLQKHVTFHVSRHTFATLSLSRGGSLLAVSRYLGHSSLTTTQTYLHLLDGQMTAAAEAIPDVRAMLSIGEKNSGHSD